MRNIIKNTFYLLLSIKKIYLVCFCALVIIVVINITHRSEHDNFFGIAESREIVINFDKAVEIKKIHKTPGQTIKDGELLIELDRPELTKMISDISHQLEELEAQLIVNTNTIKNRINQLRVEFKINKQLLAGLQSLSGKENAPAINTANLPSPIKIRISSLRKELELLVTPIKVNIRMLEKQLTLLMEEKEKLNIFAASSGLIGSINFKEGEKVAPFTPIITVHTRSPSFVKGYIHENVYNKVRIGQKTTIISMANRNIRATGEVIGVGSRIIEYPERLRFRPEFKIWGREVHIRIPGSTGFLLGEKVLINPAGLSASHNSNFFFSKTGFASENRDCRPRDISTRGTTVSCPVEASGILYLADIKKYLLISDETHKNKALLHLMDLNGTIVKEIPIKGLKKINDMEAVCKDGKGNIFLIASQSRNKKGKRSKKRKLFVWLKRNGQQFQLHKKIALYDLLSKASSDYKYREWARFLSGSIKNSQGDIDLNIEGMFFYQGAIILGLKRPFKDGYKSVTLKLNDIKSIFSRKKLSKESVELWKEFYLKDPVTGKPAAISDLYYDGSTVYILSFVKGPAAKRSGSLWAYSMTKDRVRHIMPFEDMQPEGITGNSDTGELVITFDNGSAKPSQVLRMKKPGVTERAVE
ncbi:MAG: hypothetical protein GY754_33015 [bacterium]|nr:hypothetical protein [bacterium]